MKDEPFGFENLLAAGFRMRAELSSRASPPDVEDSWRAMIERKLSLQDG